VALFILCWLKKRFQIPCICDLTDQMKNKLFGKRRQHHTKKKQKEGFESQEKHSFSSLTNKEEFDVPEPYPQRTGMLIPQGIKNYLLEKSYENTGSGCKNCGFPLIPNTGALKCKECQRLIDAQNRDIQMQKLKDASNYRCHSCDNQVLLD